MKKFLFEYVSRSAGETESFAEAFAETLCGGETLLLEGEMGAGKTLFAKGLARGLGIEDAVTSPTFALHNSYEGRTLTLNHFDFYRVTDAREAEFLGLNEFFGDRHAVSAIEWSKNVEELLPSAVVRINLSKIDENVRKITVTEEQ